ncbi:hypothetical protein BO71DRAFT_404742 [Aspergillus ellipticus CBS 707.79]|uniref:Uncharacterized protein n=1 Tax=Aspergillus ellipticus CBS 707.79 TaxID=1448320 RepID=A0A319CPF7_9EURO|nr:hypothetical protein BO71DRAFT_404742 [Aspergillus ellipticus CBS 707.79]
MSLLLLELTGEARGQFRRVGGMTVFKGALGMEDWTGFRGVEMGEWFEFENLDDEGKYLVSIV